MTTGDPIGMPEPGGEVCYVNIGGPQKTMRLAFGIVLALVSMGVTALLFLTGAPRLLRLVVGPLVWMAAVGILQYRGST